MTRHPKKAIVSVDLLFEFAGFEWVEGDVGNTTQIVVITRPKPQSGIGVRDFLFRVKIGKQDAAVGGREEDEDVPEAMHVGKVDHLPEVAEQAVADPRREGNEPHKATTHPHIVHPLRTTSEKELRIQLEPTTLLMKNRFCFVKTLSPQMFCQVSRTGLFCIQAVIKIVSFEQGARWVFESHAWFLLGSLQIVELGL